MNLNSLFSIQADLDKHIVEKHNLEEQDLLKKKTVALLTELYECVNEARFFKFWSEDQKARTEYVIETTYLYADGEEKPVEKFEHKLPGNPLLEEYVDTIHFALSIANDLDYTEHTYQEPTVYDLSDLTIGLTNLITLIPESRYQRHISTVFNLLIKLGYQLGFEEKDVIQAYMAKNKTNHERQKAGY